MLKTIGVLLISCAAAGIASADTAMCTIKIQDVLKGTDYTVTAKFDAASNDAGRRKHFDTPGKDYSCTLAYFGLGNGTMLSCGFNGDLKETYFQSDRTSREDPRSDNYLTFRHRGAHFSIESKCTGIHD